MARGGPAVPEPDGRRQHDEDREQRLAALRIRLQAAAQDVRTAEDWARRLRTASRTAVGRNLGERPADLIPEIRRDAGEGL